MDYVIPGNDDAIRAVKLYVTAVADAVLAGKAQAGEVVSADEFVEVTEPEAEPAAPTGEVSEAPAEEVAEAAAPEGEAAVPAAAAEAAPENQEADSGASADSDAAEGTVEGTVEGAADEAEPPAS